MESKYFVAYKSGGAVECEDSDALAKELLMAKSNGKGVQVYYGIRGEFSSDGAKFKCGSLEIDLTEAVSWRSCSKEWEDGK